MTPATPVKDAERADTAQWQAFALRLGDIGERIFRAIAGTRGPNQALIPALLYARDGRSKRLQRAFRFLEARYS